MVILTFVVLAAVGFLSSADSPEMLADEKPETPGCSAVTDVTLPLAKRQFPPGPHHRPGPHQPPAGRRTRPRRTRRAPAVERGRPTPNAARCVHFPPRGWLTVTVRAVIVDFDD